MWKSTAENLITALQCSGQKEEPLTQLIDHLLGDTGKSGSAGDWHIKGPQNRVCAFILSHAALACCAVSEADLSEHSIMSTCSSVLPYSWLLSSAGRSDNTQDTS